MIVLLLTSHIGGKVGINDFKSEQDTFLDIKFLFVHITEYCFVDER